MSDSQEKSQLNTFSTIVSILAVVVSIMITMGGYFATTATTVEKISRIETTLPQIQQKLDSVMANIHKHELTLSELRAQQRLNEANTNSALNSIKEDDADNERAIETALTELEELKEEVRRLRNALRN